jgi:hypothetical protein
MQLGSGAAQDKAWLTWEEVKQKTSEVAGVAQKKAGEAADSAKSTLYETKVQAHIYFWGVKTLLVIVMPD